MTRLGVFVAGSALGVLLARVPAVAQQAMKVEAARSTTSAPQQQSAPRTRRTPTQSESATGVETEGTPLRIRPDLPTPPEVLERPPMLPWSLTGGVSWVWDRGHLWIKWAGPKSRRVYIHVNGKGPSEPILNAGSWRETLPASAYGRSLRYRVCALPTTVCSEEIELVHTRVWGL